MQLKKKILIVGIILVIVFLSGGYISMDWLRFYHKPDRIEFLQAPFSPYFKVFVSFLSLLLVFLTGRDCEEKSDLKRLKLTFLFIFLADFSFLLNQEVVGIAIFSLCQLLLIYRNGRGMLGFFRNREWIKYKKPLVKYALASLLVGVIPLIIIGRLISGNPLLYVFTVYIIFLCTSFFTAWTSHLVKKFSKINSYLISIGMTFFVLCDITVGLNIVLTIIDKTKVIEFAWMISSSLTWMFYTPALVLLATSGYNIKKNN